MLPLTVKLHKLERSAIRQRIATLMSQMRLAEDAGDDQGMLDAAEAIEREANALNRHAIENGL